VADRDLAASTGNRFVQAYAEHRKALVSALKSAAADATRAQAASQKGKQRAVSLLQAIGEGLVNLWAHHVGIRPRGKSLRRWARGLGRKLRRIDPKLMELRRQLRMIRKRNRRLQKVPFSSWPARLARARRIGLCLRLHMGKLLLLGTLLLAVSYLWLVDAPIVRQVRELWQLMLLGWQS
jgi:hypothetical protein